MNHKDLEVWKKSMELVIDIYKLTNEFPEDEKFGISSHLNLKKFTKELTI